MVVLVVRNYLGSSEPVSVDSYGLGNVSKPAPPRARLLRRPSAGSRSRA